MRWMCVLTSSWLQLEKFVSSRFDLSSVVTTVTANAEKKKTIVYPIVVTRCFSDVLSQIRNNETKAVVARGKTT